MQDGGGLHELPPLTPHTPVGSALPFYYDHEETQEPLDDLDPGEEQLVYPPPLTPTAPPLSPTHSQRSVHSPSSPFHLVIEPDALDSASPDDGEPPYSPSSGPSHRRNLSTPHTPGHSPAHSPTSSPRGTNEPTTVTSIAYFNRLSDDALMQIMSHLPPPTLHCCTMLSRRFRRVAGQDALWKALFNEYMPQSLAEERASGAPWRSFYCAEAKKQVAFFRAADERRKAVRIDYTGVLTRWPCLALHWTLLLAFLVLLHLRLEHVIPAGVPWIANLAPLCLVVALLIATAIRTLCRVVQHRRNPAVARMAVPVILFLVAAVVLLAATSLLSLPLDQAASSSPPSPPPSFTMALALDMVTCVLAFLAMLRWPAPQIGFLPTRVATVLVVCAFLFTLLLTLLLAGAFEVVFWAIAAPLWAALVFWALVITAGGVRLAAHKERGCCVCCVQHLGSSAPICASLLLLCLTLGHPSLHLPPVAFLTPLYALVVLFPLQGPAVIQRIRTCSMMHPDEM
eukprot:gnl/Trimastix_PCT/1736.p1 GENE.gnl/Trimastix_PCT/1736~~gnl/Trimastix_PCT/1736.p1  ORF type:complete len:524 (+),score=131.02 gnl/Trimastix_PCT/1736:42-1574(+)